MEMYINRGNFRRKKVGKRIVKNKGQEERERFVIGW